MTTLCLICADTALSNSHNQPQVTTTTKVKVNRTEVQKVNSNS